MSLFKRYANTLTKRYANFSSRANRRAYCAFMIVFYTYRLIGTAFLGCAMSTFIDKHDGYLSIRIAKLSYSVAFGYLFLEFMGMIHGIPFWALQVRRLHDLDTSGWWVLLILFLAVLLNNIGIHGVLTMNAFFAFLGFMEGSPKENDYGNPPARKDNVANTHWILAVILCIDTIINLVY
ncbi:MAG: DUF805 domain-containing protein [Bacteroidota bacterium]